MQDILILGIAKVPQHIFSTNFFIWDEIIQVKLHYRGRLSYFHLKIAFQFDTTFGTFFLTKILIPIPRKLYALVDRKRIQLGDG